jgi:hypothetical protein
MLAPDEEKYLSKIPADQKVDFFPYDSKTPEIAGEFIYKIKNAILDAKVSFIGASALEISGQGDIDITILTSPNKYADYLPKLKKIFGEPKPGMSVIEWNFISHNHEVSIYMDDPEKDSVKQQIKTFNILKNDKKLLAEYEKLKAGASGFSLREYQRVKYNFYHKILGEKP